MSRTQEMIFGYSADDLKVTVCRLDRVNSPPGAVEAGKTGKRFFKQRAGRLLEHAGSAYRKVHASPPSSVTRKRSVSRHRIEFRPSSRFTASPFDSFSSFFSLSNVTSSSSVPSIFEREPIRSLPAPGDQFVSIPAHDQID